MFLLNTNLYLEELLFLNQWIERLQLFRLYSLISERKEERRKKSRLKREYATDNEKKKFFFLLGKLNSVMD